MQDAFADATKADGGSSLTLGVTYPDEDDDQGRTVEAYFTVNGAYQLSPAGKKLKKELAQVRGVWSND